MFNWIKKLKCSHDWYFLTIKENTCGKKNQTKYEHSYDWSKGFWQGTWLRTKFTFVVYRICKNCCEKKEIAEFFGTEKAEKEAEYLANRMNELQKNS